MRKLPERPSLDQLRTQAKELVKTTRPTNPKYRLSQAQRDLAREYGFPSWPRLAAHIEAMTLRPQFESAIQAGNLAEVRRLAEANPALIDSAPQTDNDIPINIAAKFGHLEIVRYLRGKGDPDLQHAFSRAGMWAHEEIMRYLIAEGADVNGPYAKDMWRYGPPINAVFEVQNAEALRLMIRLGARLEWTTSDGRHRTPLEMLIATYGRQVESKHACLQICAENGYALPDTPPMALHAGRLDRLAEFLADDPSLLSRRFGIEEVYPASIGIESPVGACVVSVAGSTLLHQAVEWCDPGAVRWLLDRGADPNARATADADGFGDHTPLFHAAATYGPRTDRLARTLVAAGADLHIRADIRLRFPDQETAEYVFTQVTPAEFAGQDHPFFCKNATAAAYLASVT